MIRTILFVLIVGGSTLVESQRPRDPRCVAANCPSGTTCRVVSRCPNPMSCSLEAECLANPPRASRPGRCRIGDPIMIEINGRLRDTYCGPYLSCPESTFCDTRLQDSYSTCCASNPAAPVKPGRCPAAHFTPGQVCFHTCSNDGDCLHRRKCCSTGCGTSCRAPRRRNTNRRPPPPPF